ncbi:nicotinamide-nucleotide amidohydrolase family protein [Vibrio sp. SCSIO 43136]|uniref:nicotinamide-nucleotide amidohydrolase family protein n=1 Tax=Vibrio sp. SCSIO 43136 TaxID=2819101 RepID=UPI0020750980|nr:nicotinamide-nucleotide amidohydrolase family protein [Vibrio sp. SCSIO 43136]USD65683.1 nicotinamide-nucleotide amidohydrolase family protein [Vibrio sp. SCSIO 43136]
MQAITILSEKLGQSMLQKGKVLTTAESCTGGMISAAVTDIAGSSSWFDRAFITYSNQAKVEMLQVDELKLEQEGAVSEVVVGQMVIGALKHSNANIGVAVSGIAGPGGGTPTKPVGTVCFGFADNQGWLRIETAYFDGDRATVRQQVTEYALKVLLEHLSPESLL